MEENILITLKKLLGIDPEYDVFDEEIKVHANSVFMILHQLGVGPDPAFAIRTGNETWDSFFDPGDPDFEATKSYLYLRIRLLFDPPTSSFVLSSFEQQSKEYEWRLRERNEIKILGEPT